MDLGVLGPPYITNLTFLALTLPLLASGALVDEVVSASVLTREVAAGERRWLSFMQRVNLLVAGSDLEGNINYVNPHCCRVLGYSPEELLGKQAVDLVPEDERSELKQRLEKAREGQVRQRVSRVMLTKDARLRQVNWFHVVLGDSDDRIPDHRSAPAHPPGEHPLAREPFCAANRCQNRQDRRPDPSACAR
jgi:PAS domain S-box-containing protein